jgi:histone-lysine N-methyltransferase SETMAR
LIKDNCQCRSQRESASKKKALLCVWWNYEGLIYYELVPDGHTINAEVYSQQLKKMFTVLLEKCPAPVNRKHVYFSKITLVHMRRRKLFRKSKNWKVLNCYRLPLLVLINCYLFRSMAQFLRGKKFQSVADVEVAVEELFASKDKEWLYQAFKKFAEKWVKTIEHEGLYFEYLIIFILYVLAIKSVHFECDIIYGTSSVYFFISRPLPSNRSTCHNINISHLRHANKYSGFISKVRLAYKGPFRQIIKHYCWSGTRFQ